MYTYLYNIYIYIWATAGGSPPLSTSCLPRSSTPPPVDLWFWWFCNGYIICSIKIRAPAIDRRSSRRRPSKFDGGGGRVGRGGGALALSPGAYIYT